MTDIEVPDTVPFDASDNVGPEMEPFTVFEDSRVMVRAILVDHHPTAPAFAIRFDSQYGSIVISGDTGYCENTITLAEDSDLLFHEAIDLEVVEYRMRHYSARNDARQSYRTTVVRRLPQRMLAGWRSGLVQSTYIAPRDPC